MVSGFKTTEMAVMTWLVELLLAALVSSPGLEPACTPAWEKPGLACPLGWIERTNPVNCVMYPPQRKTWADAASYCQRVGGDLVKSHFDSMANDLFIFKNTVSFDAVWIGLKLDLSFVFWTWLHENASATYFNWKPPAPYLLRERCSIVSMKGYMWMPQDCVDFALIMCEKPRPGFGCDEDWADLVSTPWCVSYFEEIVDYATAESKCKSLGATLLTIRSKAKHDSLTPFWTYRQHSWIGLSDIYKEGEYWWAHGGVAYDAMNYVKSDGGRKENCVASNGSFTSWVDVNCDLKIRFICQRPSRLGHGNTDIDLNARFTEPPTSNRDAIHIFFKGDQIESTCRALRMSNGKHGWAFIYGNGTKTYPAGWNLGSFITHSYVTMEIAGKCENVTISQLSVPAVRSMDNTSIACFTKDIIARSWCSGTGNPLEFCMKTNQLKILGGPLGTPELTINYHKQPPAVVEGRYLMARCQVLPGEGGSLVWVIYTSSSTRTLKNQRDSEVISENTSTPQGKPTSIKSVIKFKVSASFQAGKIACFAYDISKAKRIDCKRTDQFCILSPPFEVVQDGGAWGCFGFLQPCFFIVIIVTLLVPLFLFWPTRKHDYELKEQGREDSYLPQSGRR